MSCGKSPGFFKIKISGVEPMNIYGFFFRCSKIMAASIRGVCESFLIEIKRNSHKNVAISGDSFTVAIMHYNSLCFLS